MTMRRTFAGLLLNEMEQNSAIVIVSTDLGFGIWDMLREKFPDRFINAGAAEQAAAGISIGLALSGKVPVLYSITPFLLCRPFEFWRNYLHHERIPVKLVGSGRNRDYDRDGFSHSAEDDAEILALWPEIEGLWPADEDELTTIFDDFLSRSTPVYLNLRR